MTVVFVHGVPETAAIWRSLVDRLGRDDVVLLSPPGFGAPLPDGFAPSSDAYADWLVAELEQLDGPVDLIGHDWGGGHAMRAVTRRPDLVRRFATDIAGLSDPKYEWHDMAKIWQTDGDGEALVDAMSALPVDQRAEAFVGAGMSADAARACAEANGPDMGRCILALYRSAKQPNMILWGDQYTELGSRRPETLVIVPHDDPYTGGPDLARRTAQRWQASTAELPGLGHWWMMQDPDAGAAALGDFLG